MAITLPTFDDLVGVFVADVVSYWRFQTTGTDEQGTANATITGFPELDVPTLVDIDTIAEDAPEDGTVIAWRGTAGEYAQAAHSAAHKTAAGTVIIYFQRDASVEKSQLIMADAAGAEGGMAVGINIDGSPDFYLRGAGGTPVTLIGGAGDVQRDHAYCLLAKWGSPGMSLALYDEAGALLRRVTNTVTSGLSGTSAIRFGASHTDTNHHDGPYGRVIWLDRRIAGAEEVHFGIRARTIARQDVTTSDTYSSTVTGITGLVAYWRLGDTSAATLADASGNGRTGSYPATPTFGSTSLTWQASDSRAVNFAGTGYGQVAHNAAFATARGTLCGYFMANNLGVNQTFVNKGAGFVLQALTNGTLQLTIGNQTFASQPGTIEPGVEYHIAVCWDQVVVFLLCDGHVMSWGRTHTTGLTVNSSNWQFGCTTSGTNSNVRADEIALYNRRLSWEELWELSEYIAGLPYNPTPETSQVVSSSAALTTALTTGGSAPGHHILVAPGSYSVNTTIPATRSGLKRRPIVVRPQKPGTVSMNGRNITFNNRWMVFEGFKSTSGQYVAESGSRYLRFTRHTCTMSVNFHCFHLHGRFCRFDHNDVSNVLVAKRPYHFDPNRGNDGYYNLIDHAYTHHSPNNANNGGPGFGLGTSGQDRDFFICTMMYKNLFTNYFVDDEVVTTKSKGNIFIKNTVDCPGGGVRYPGRLGSLSWVESEWWESIGSPSGNSGAGFFGSDNVLVGCRLNGGRGSLRTGNIEVADYIGFYKVDPYPACFNSLIIGLTIGSGTLGFIVGHQSNAVLNVPVRNTQIDQSPGVTVKSTWAVNTTISPTARIPFTPAVRLTTGQVGVDASDPLVPAGCK